MSLAPDDQQRLPIEPFDHGPRFTMVPDRLLDEWLPHLNESELKVALTLVRYTLGWRRNACQVTTRRLAKHCDLSQRSVRRATARLAKAGVISIQIHQHRNGQAANSYHIVWREAPPEIDDD